MRADAGWPGTLKRLPVSVIAVIPTITTAIPTITAGD
jgi:hypothetical protein